MKLLFALGLAFLAALATPVLGTTFEYAYVFSSGEVTGTFKGTQNGDFVEGISNITVNFSGGIAVTGPIYTGTYDSSGGGGYKAGAVISFNGALCNFIFVNSDLVNGDDSFDSYFYIDNSGGWAGKAYPNPDTELVEDLVPENWTLTAVSTGVPDVASTFTLLALALVPLGWLARRRRTA